LQNDSTGNLIRISELTEQLQPEIASFFNLRVGEVEKGKPGIAGRRFKDGNEVW
jgi:hypothetical protein